MPKVYNFSASFHFSPHGNKFLSEPVCQKLFNELAEFKYYQMTFQYS